MGNWRQLSAILAAFMLAVGLNLGASGHSRAQDTGDALTPSAAIEEQARKGADAIEAGDYDAAVQILDPLAKKDHLPSLMALGYLYRKETRGLNDDEKAFGYFKKAAQMGSEKAKLLVALSYDNGRGVKKNGKEAQSLFKELASCGMIWGHTNYGLSLSSKPSLNQTDLELANKHFRLAIAHGDVAAQFGLAVNLIFRKRQYDEGWRWMVISAQNGWSDAIDAIEKFENDPNFEYHIKSARLYAEQWQGPKPPPIDELTKCK